LLEGGSIEHNLNSMQPVVPLCGLPEHCGAERLPAA
jgi:hypothetical protein